MARFHNVNAFCVIANRDLALFSKGNFIAFKKIYPLFSKPDKVMSKGLRSQHEGAPLVNIGTI